MTDHRPLPPTPLLKKYFSEDNDASSHSPQYHCIEDVESKVFRKSSMPSEPPPLPPVMIDVNDDVGQGVYLTPRPSTESSSLKERKFGENETKFGKGQNSEKATSCEAEIKAKHSDTVSMRSTQPHPIAKMLEQRQNSNLQQSIDDCSLPHNKRFQNFVEKGETGIVSVDENNLLSLKPEAQKLPYRLKLTSTPKAIAPPKTAKLIGNASETTSRPTALSKKPNHFTSRDSPKKNDVFSEALQISTKNNLSKLTGDSESVQNSSEVSKSPESSSPQMHFKKANYGSEIEANLKSPKTNLTSNICDPKENKSSLNFPFKRIVDKKGYTLHKLQVERLNKSNASRKSSQFNSSSYHKEVHVKPEVSPEFLDLNLYHVIEDKIDKTSSFGDKKNLMLPMNEVEKEAHPVDGNKKNLSRILSLSSSTSVEGTLMKSPKIKPKPRPTAPPPPRPTGPPPPRPTQLPPVKLTQPHAPRQNERADPCTKTNLAAPQSKAKREFPTCIIVQCNSNISFKLNESCYHCLSKLYKSTFLSGW